FKVIDYLIIGGGIAGTAAAEAIRSKDSEGSVAVVSAEPHFLYSRVLLPEFVKGEVGLDKVMLRSEADYREKGIKIILGEKVAVLDLTARRAELASGEKLEFKKLLIASGGGPEPWIFEKEAPESIFRLQTLDDAKRMLAFFEERKSGEALVVGGGFIALELAEILAKRNFRTEIICREKSLWGGYLDDECLGFLKGVWAGHGITFVSEDEADSVKRENGRALIKTQKGRTFEADFVGVGIGIRRNLDFFPHLVVGPLSGGAEVNEYLETGFPDVWAAGDAAYYPDLMTGKKRLCRTWSEAFMQGRVAGLNMARLRRQAGGKEVFKMIPAYSIGHFGQTITFVGDIFTSGGAFDSRGSVLTKLAGKKEGEYVRISEEGGVIRGAVMINAQNMVGSVFKAILNEETVEEYLRKS
ncbi:MAG: NAD(P)/FAD-dependent oxidoreductase, partial [Candidatus Niyogibacteria bacterium]|nr:NAD(P)/FAD-dependent oxidoreductase [Candidatus Niyogibacteria bacterium]